MLYKRKRVVLFIYSKFPNLFLKRIPSSDKPPAIGKWLLFLLGQSDILHPLDKLGGDILFPHTRLYVCHYIIICVRMA